MLIAIASVSVLIMLALGIRESGIVAIAIPVTLALTLAVFYFYGYTLNRITLFALIFSIGILVDDAIVVVENMTRHYGLPENKGRPLVEIAVAAVDEVGNPTILATFAVMAAILPMAFVGGLMGPYMRPIPIGASAAMVFSMLVAFVVTPWASLKAAQTKQKARARQRRLYDQTLPQGDEPHHLPAASGVTPFSAAWFLLLLGAMSLVFLKFVKVKMLPFDNKSEFQVIVDMPEGSTLEQTAAVTRELAGYVANDARDRQLPDVCRHLGPVQFQRSGASLFSAAWFECRGYSGQSPLKRRTLAAKSRHCKTRPARLAADRTKIRCERQNSRGSARPARSSDHRCRDLRPRL